MKVRYIADTDTALVEFTDNNEVAETKEMLLLAALWVPMAGTYNPLHRIGRKRCMLPYERRVIGQNNHG